MTGVQTCALPISVIINLFNWIDSEYMIISWEFLFDQLTVSMFIPVLYISFPNSKYDKTLFLTILVQMLKEGGKNLSH